MCRFAHILTVVSLPGFPKEQFTLRIKIITKFKYLYLILKYRYLGKSCFLFVIEASTVFVEPVQCSQQSNCMGIFPYMRFGNTGRSREGTKYGHLHEVQ